MQFNEIAPAEYARMQDATKPVVEKFSAEYDPARVKLFNERAGAHPRASQSST